MPRTRKRFSDQPSMCVSGSEKPRVKVRVKAEGCKYQFPYSSSLSRHLTFTFTLRMPETTNKAPTVLVIDDDAEIRYSLSRVLSSRGYQVAEAPSGEQGIALVKKGPPPDLAFLDVRMS